MSDTPYVCLEFCGPLQNIKQNENDNINLDS